MRPEHSYYEAETRGVAVRVVTSYLPQHSDPDEGRWVWAYMVEIENRGQETVQLVSRRWEITDAHGRIDVVEGPGVIGEQPVIAPGQTHRYTSGCPLPTPSGAMVGVFRMVPEQSPPFDAAIPAFSLDLPDARRVLN